MPLTPLYEADVVVLEIERDQRREMLTRLAQLARKVETLERIVDAAPADDTVSRGSRSGPGYPALDRRQPGDGD